MPLEQRQAIMKEIETLRNGRVPICFFDFDRESNPNVQGLRRQFASDTKEPLFRILKESIKNDDKVDLILYTRGGDVNAVWPIAGLLREFDPDFEVLVPFRCHSGGTLLALGANRIIMTSLAELSPIDPSTGNQFNPSDPGKPNNRLAISVEDVQAYRRFIIDQFNERNNEDNVIADSLFQPFLDRLVNSIHPLALGNVHRVYQQIKELARKLLGTHPIEDKNTSDIITALTTRFYSHLHMINREEAQEILGANRVEYAGNKLEELLDALLRTYEDDFHLRQPFFLNAHLGDDLQKEARFIGGTLESPKWAYIYETNALLRQRSVVPANVQIQLPPGQPMPLIPGLARQYEVEVTSCCWAHNTSPKGVTV